MKFHFITKQSMEHNLLLKPIMFLQVPNSNQQNYETPSNFVKEHVEIFYIFHFQSIYL